MLSHPCMVLNLSLEFCLGGRSLLTDPWFLLSHKKDELLACWATCTLVVSCVFSGCTRPGWLVLLSPSNAFFFSVCWFLTWCPCWVAPLWHSCGPVGVLALGKQDAFRPLSILDGQACMLSLLDFVFLLLSWGSAFLAKRFLFKIDVFGGVCMLVVGLGS